MDLRAGPTRKVILRTSRLCNPQNTHALPRRDRGCHNTRLYIPLAHVCRSVLSRKHWRMALSKLGNITLERTRRIGQAWAVLSYYTDQLMTPCSKYFSGGADFFPCFSHEFAFSNSNIQISQRRLGEGAPTASQSARRELAPTYTYQAYRLVCSHLRNTSSMASSVDQYSSSARPKPVRSSSSFPT